VILSYTKTQNPESADNNASGKENLPNDWVDAQIVMQMLKISN